ncbi:UNVERIFIED_CONTAM: Coiled-coil domain-containing protein 33 [Siphonaria sp. JEL0065]|nr:Coiled-coil domain-containing protein 33 [Siphonaria sp. JEL0065]
MVPNFTPEKDIVIPPYTNFSYAFSVYPDMPMFHVSNIALFPTSLLGATLGIGDSLHQDWTTWITSSWAFSKRPIYAYFRGTIIDDYRYSFGVRQYIRELGNTLPERYYVRDRHTSQEAYWNELGSSTSPRLFDCIVAGSIPVVFADDIVFPYQSQIPYKKIIIQIKNKDMASLDSVLNRVGEAEILKRRLEILRTRHMFDWNNGGSLKCLFKELKMKSKQTRMDPKLAVSISEAEFEDEGNYYLKFEVAFCGQPASEKPPRTDVSTPPSRHPQFSPNSFSFAIPPTASNKSTQAGIKEEPALKITVSAVKVEKTRDGSASVTKVGSHVFQFQDFNTLKSQISAKESDLVAFMSDPVPGFPTRVAGHVRIGISLDSLVDHTTGRNSILGSADRRVSRADEGFGTNLLRRARFDDDDDAGGSRDHNNQLDPTHESSKRFIAKFVLPIPVAFFPSHWQQTLMLRSVSTVHKECTPCIRVSIRNEDPSVVKPSMLQREYSCKMMILECFLRGVVLREFPFSLRCIAAVKVIHSTSEYVAKMNLIQKRLQDGCPTSFPQLAPITQLDFDSNGTLISDYPLIKDAMPPSSIHNKSNSGGVVAASKRRQGKETRPVVKLDKVDILFMGQYRINNNSGGGSDVVCSLDIRVPENWNQINPDTLKPKTNLKTTDKKYGGGSTASFRGSFEQLLEMVKAERETELTAAAAAEEDASSDSREVTFKYSDVAQRQKLIDRLLQELENRSQAIQKLGLDIVAGKERNLKLEDKIKHLESKLHEKEVKTNQLLNTIDIQDIPHSELQRRYTSMADRLHSEIAKNKDLLKQVESSNMILMERNDFEKRYLELQQAHMAQQNLVQRLQRDQDELQDSKETIKKQENVISKLGNYLKDRMPSSMQGKIDGAIMAKDPQDVDLNLQRILADENLQLKKQITELEKKLENQRRDSDEYPKSTNGGAVSEEEYFEVLMRAESNETRIIALEQELSTNAREFAKQLAQMQKKMMAKDLSKPIPSLGTLKESSRSPDGRDSRHSRHQSPFSKSRQSKPKSEDAYHSRDEERKQRLFDDIDDLGRSLKNDRLSPSEYQSKKTDASSNFYEGSRYMKGYTMKEYDQDYPRRERTRTRSNGAMEPRRKEKSRSDAREDDRRLGRGDFDKAGDIDEGETKRRTLTNTKRLNPIFKYSK